MDASTTGEIVNCVLLAVAHCSHVDFVTTKSATTQWTGQWGIDSSVTRLRFNSLTSTYSSAFLFGFLRHATTEVMCMSCLEIQHVSQHCITPACKGRSLARYFCSICKFFDDADRYRLSLPQRFSASPARVILTAVAS